MRAWTRALLLLLACGAPAACSLARRPGSFEGFCFVADTLVLTPSGSARIADLRPGDAILSFDLATSSMVATTVRERFEWTASPILRLDTGRGAVRGVTESHPVYHVESGSYLPVAELLRRSDRRVLVHDGTTTEPSTLESVVFDDREVPVYTLAVESVHANFFADGLLVHNKGRGGSHRDALPDDDGWAPDREDDAEGDARGDQGTLVDGGTDPLDAGVPADSSLGDGGVLD